MQIALIGDIHGNLPALEAVLADIGRRHVDEVWCHGDVCYGGPWPRECATLVRSTCRVVTRGNTDDLLVEVDPHDRIAQRDRVELGAELASWLGSLPVEHEQDLILTHATRKSNRERLPPLEASDDIWRTAFGPPPATIVCGHSHVAFTRPVGVNLRVLNTGSVGAPFDGDPRASYLLGTREGAIWRFSHHRSDYDREVSARTFDDLGHSEGRRWAHAIRTGRHP